jgi:predicted small lipoprotein YifL
MKRLLLNLAVLTSMLFMLASCGSSDSGSETPSSKKESDIVCMGWS